MLENFPLTKTSLNIIWGDENDNDINKAFARVIRVMRFVKNTEIK